MQQPYSDDALVTATEFATHAGIQPATVAVWRNRYHLPAHGKRGRELLHRFGDLLEVERKTRRRVAENGGWQRGVTRNRAA